MFRGHISQGSLNKQHQQEIYRDIEEMMDWFMSNNQGN